MKQIIVDIPESKYSFFLELINNLGFTGNAQKDENVEKENPVFKSLQQGLKEMEQAKEGKLKTRSLKEFLDEI